MRKSRSRPASSIGTSNVTVTAFPGHGMRRWSNSFSYRFDTKDRNIVISGDTAPTQAMLEHSRGCDVLVHEAYALGGSEHGAVRPTPEFRRRHHTSSDESWPSIANTVKPGLLVTYHRSTTGTMRVDASDEEDVLVEGDAREPL